MASANLAHVARRTLAVGPSVKHLLAQYNLDPRQIASTGPHQILLKIDVLNYISQKKLQVGGSNQVSSSAASGAMSTSANKPTSSTSISLKGLRVIHITDESTLSSRYGRKKPTQLEIDVINNGGRL